MGAEEILVTECQRHTHIYYSDLYKKKNLSRVTSIDLHLSSYINIIILLNILPSYPPPLLKSFEMLKSI